MSRRGLIVGAIILVVVLVTWYLVSFAGILQGPV
jgi:hypothetical protein